MFGAGHGFMGGGMIGLFWNILITVLVFFLAMKDINSFKTKEPAYVHNRD